MPRRAKCSAAKKAQVLAECREPRVALARGINANVVRRWRQLAREGSSDAVAETSELLALPLPAPGVSAATPADLGTVFVQDSADAARAQWRSAADQLRGRFPKLGTLMDEDENDVLAFMTFPRAHWTQIYSANPLERLNAEITRRTTIVGIFPDDASIVRLVGAMMLEQNDEWSLNRTVSNCTDIMTPAELQQVPALIRAAAERATGAPSYCCAASDVELCRRVSERL